jgi:DNA-directed RNA polymerase specialized sigma24 family protein
MQTRKQYAEQLRLEKEHRMTLEDDLSDLQSLFLPRPKPPSRRRKAIAKKRIRINQKVKLLHLEQILKLRYVQKLSYVKIGEQLRMSDMTVYSALKRYESQGGVLLDGRKFNGHNNPLHKITPELARAMLNRDLLQ